MQKFLKVIGFSEIDNNGLQTILDDVLNSPSCRYIIGKDRDDIFIEYIKYFGKNIGIAVRGFFDSEEKVKIQSWAPYIETSNKTEITEVDIDMNDKKECFAICLEEETGNQIGFYLQNVVDFMNVEDDEDTTISGAYMVGLAIEGTVIFPIKKDFIDGIIEGEKNNLYKSLIKLVREGDNEAEQILQIQEQEMTETLVHRLDKEDLFSVIENYFLLNDDKNLIYNILGTIQKVDIIKNTTTKEKIYKLSINTMGIDMDICINSKNLLGMPMVGMRFKGKCWIQGRLIFE